MKKLLPLFLLLLSSTAHAVPTADAGPRYFHELATKPPVVADTGVVYAKDGTGVTQLYYEFPTGVEVLLAGTGGLAEVDPIFAASSAYGITAGNISNWNTTYGYVNQDLKTSASPSFTALTIGAVTVPTVSSTSTFTNKRMTPRMFTTASIAGSPGVLTPEIDTYDYYEITAQAAPLNIANMVTSTPTGGEKMTIVITSDATPRALTYGTNYVAKGGVALPTTTVASKMVSLGFVYNQNLGKWILVAVAQES